MPEMSQTIVLISTQKEKVLYQVEYAFNIKTIQRLKKIKRYVKYTQTRPIQRAFKTEKIIYLLVNET